MVNPRPTGDSLRIMVNLTKCKWGLVIHRHGHRHRHKHVYLYMCIYIYIQQTSLRLRAFQGPERVRTKFPWGLVRTSHITRIGYGSGMGSVWDPAFGNLGIPEVFLAHTHIYIYISFV